MAEIERILKPGGWFCARTPNKWGYISLGANLIPNSLHVRFLKFLQPDRQEEDVFPTRYRMNTIAALKTHFPPNAGATTAIRGTPSRPILPRT